MAVDSGYGFARTDIEQSVADITVRLADVLAEISRRKVRLIDDHTQAEIRAIYAADTRPGEDLTATNAKADLARTSILDLETIARVAHAQATVPAANDFFFNARFMTGVRGV